MSTGICSLLMERSRIKMTIVPAPGKLPADGGGWSFSGTRGEGRTERGDGFPPFRFEKIEKREQKRRLRCPLMLETGMRPEEVYRIQPENVNLTGGYLFNPHGKTKATRRRVPLTTAARGVLHRRMDGPEDFLPLPVRDGPRPTRAQGEQCPRPRCEGVARWLPSGCMIFAILGRPGRQRRASTL